MFDPKIVPRPQGTTPSWKDAALVIRVMVGPGGSADRVKVTTFDTAVADTEIVPALAPAVALTEAMPWLFVSAEAAESVAEPDGFRLPFTAGLVGPVYPLAQSPT